MCKHFCVIHVGLYVTTKVMTSVESFSLVCRALVREMLAVRRKCCLSKRDIITSFEEIIF